MAAPTRASDLDVGTRLYHATTRATTSKTAPHRSARERETARLMQQLQNIDVRDEVERIYDSIVASVDDTGARAVVEDALRPVMFSDDDAAHPFQQRPSSAATASSGARSGVGVSKLALGKLRCNTFGSQARAVCQTLPRSAEPGPGAYTPRAGAFDSQKGTPRFRPASSGAATRARGRQGTDAAAPAKVPGPGEYAVPSTFQGAATPRQHPTIGRAPRETRVRSQSPGPGAYDVGQRFSGAPDQEAPAKRVPFATSAPRMPTHRAASPGPGMYDTDDTARGDAAKPRGAVFGKASTHREHTAQTRSPSPGPGQYNVAEAVAMPLRDRLTKGVIPAAKRNTVDTFGGAEKLNQEAPGPGQYDPRSLDSVRAASIRGPVKQPKRDNVPGPGAYCPEAAAVIEHAPEHAIPKAARFTDDERAARERASSPGPQSYSTSDVRMLSEYASAPSVPMQTAVRPTAKLPRESEVSPGPGAYTPMDDPRAPAAVMGTGAKDPQAAKDAVPGPGTYEVAAPPSDTHGPFFGSAPRAVNTMQSDAAAPGPGTYNADLPGGAAGPSIGTAQRGRTDPTPGSGSVGPGAYDTAASTFGDPNRAPSIGLPTAPRGGSTSTDAPGPGAYDAANPHAIGTAPATGFGVAPRFVEDTDARDKGTPGPGTYNAPSDVPEHNRAPAAFIGTAPREAAEPSSAAAPGPGTYSPKAPGDDRAPALGTADRVTHADEVAKRASAVPGPGTYAVSATVVEPQVPGAVFGSSAAHATDVRRDDLGPGPGSYMPNLDAGGVPNGPVFGSERRFTSGAFDAAEDVPGPGTYSAQPVEPHVPGVPMATAARMPHPKADTATAPGPGAYEPVDTATGERAPAVAFGSAPQREEPALRDVPGPGAYEPLQFAAEAPVRAPSAVMPVAERMPREAAADTPGPGAYAGDLPAAHGGAPHFGTAERLPAEAREYGPGPGHYSPADQLHVPSVVMHTAARMVDPPTKNVPGPGAYVVESDMAQSHGFAWTTAARPAMLNDGDPSAPGPGAYAPEHTVQFDAPPNVVFGSSTQRPAPANVAVPGPGTYDVAEPRKGPEVSIAHGGRDTERPSDVPGPGTYEPTPTTVEAGANGPTIGVSRRFVEPAARNDAPGPGAYNPDEHHDAGPAVSIAVRHKLPTDERVNVPGPGAYETDVRPGAHTGPAVALGTAPRMPPEERRDAPGPGAYNPDAARGDTGPAISIAPLPTVDADKLARDTKVPGPGAYEADGITADGHRLHDATRAPSFPTSMRFVSETSDAAKRTNLGPGAYILADPAPVAEAPSIPRAQRFATEEFRDTDVPGPGQYDVEKIGGAFAGGPAAVIATAEPADARAAAKRAAEQPGPGEYDPRVQASSTIAGVPAVSIGRAAATAKPLGLSDEPGPGQYDAVEAHEKIKPHAPAATFPVAADRGEGNAAAAARAPGPGHYDPEDPRKAGHAGVSFAQATHDAPGGAHSTGADDVPPPGLYDVAAADKLVYERAPAAEIRGRPVYRDEAGGDGNGNADGAGGTRPGPGNYDLPSTLNPHGGVIDRAARDAKDPTSDVPGPGYYAGDDYDGARGYLGHGPAYSFPQGGVGAARGEEAPRGLASGIPAGYYDAGPSKDAVLRHGPAVTIPRAAGGGLEGGQTGAYVGPGAYNVGPAPHAGPAFSFTDTRNAQPVGGPPSGGSGADGPGGPGYYNVGDAGLHRGPAFTIAGRDAWRPRDGSDGSGLGPGHYNVTDYDPYQRSTFGINMARQGARPPPAPIVGAGSGLGPGYYNQQTVWGDGGGARMHWRFVEPFFDPSPGPPDYWPSDPVPAFHKPHSEAM